jgi:hypothetical protein
VPNVTEATIQPFDLRVRRSAGTIELDIARTRIISQNQSHFATGFRAMREAVDNAVNIQEMDPALAAYIWQEITTTIESADVLTHSLREAVCDRLLTDQERMEQRARGNNEHLRRFHAELAALNEPVPSDITIKLADIKKAMRAVANVIPPRHIRIAVEHGVPNLRWRVQGLQMRPLRNDHQAINVGAEVALPLPAFALNLPLNRGGRITAVRVRGEPGYPLYTRNSIHPHMMGGRYFCLGDYTGPLEELKMSYEWPGLMLLMKQFLETCNPDDPAGQTWTRMLQTQLDNALHARCPDVRWSTELQGYGTTSRLQVTSHGATLAFNRTSVAAVQTAAGWAFIQLQMCTPPNTNDLVYKPVDWDTQFASAAVHAQNGVHPLRNMLPTKAEYDYIAHQFSLPHDERDRKLDWDKALAAPEVRSTEDEAPGAVFVPEIDIYQQTLDAIDRAAERMAAENFRGQRVHSIIVDDVFEAAEDGDTPISFLEGTQWIPEEIADATNSPAVTIEQPRVRVLGEVTTLDEAFAA